MTKLLFNLDEELLSARVFTERTEAMLGALCEEYFADSGAHNPDTPQGQSNIINGFEQNRVCAEIARDYALQTWQTLNAMAAIIKTGDGGHPDPMRRLEELNIAALRAGKGDDAITILKKHEVSRFEDVPIGKFKPLEADFAALLEG